MRTTRPRSLKSSFLTALWPAHRPLGGGGQKMQMLFLRFSRFSNFFLHFWAYLFGDLEQIIFSGFPPLFFGILWPFFVVFSYFSEFEFLKNFCYIFALSNCSKRKATSIYLNRRHDAHILLKIFEISKETRLVSTLEIPHKARIKIRLFIFLHLFCIFSFFWGWVGNTGL